jgi:eukaryotic-like serine/threonine-protein kinase
MGEVFLVENEKLGRPEALKILMPSLATDPMFVSRFRREARAVGRLRHPNIIEIFDFGQLEDERFFLSMEYADGASVKDIIKSGGAFSVPRMLHVMGQLAYAVHHAHSRGVVHRDLKPDNLILVGEHDTLKVLDFGIAKIVASDVDESVALSTGKIVWGTPSYMSPERATGIGNDPRSDLYSMGCLAYELLTGKPPFVGHSTDVVKAHLTVTPVMPGSLLPNARIPAELDAVLAKLLVKKPELRFQTAADLYAALSRVPGFVALDDLRRRRAPSTS